MVKDVKKIMDLYGVCKGLECKDDDVNCILKKAKACVEMNKALDKLLYQLAFAMGNELIRSEIEKIVDMLIQNGLVTSERWLKVVNDTMRYKERKLSKTQRI